MKQNFYHILLQKLSLTLLVTALAFGGPAFGQTYCANMTTNGCAFTDYIDDFTVGPLSHLATGCSPSGYGNFTNMTVLFTPGQSYTWTATYGLGGQHIAMWIDFNDDGDFDDTGELLYSSPSSGMTTDNFVMPLTATPGQHRFRVRNKWAGSSMTATDACTHFTYSEIHDYTAIIPGGGPIDLATVSLPSPISSCGMSANEQVTAIFQSFGSDSLPVGDTFTVSYSVNGGTPISEQITLTNQVDFLDSVVHTFTTGADLSVPGDYTIQAWVTKAGDSTAYNDTATVEVTSIPLVTTFPYFEDFESGTGGWAAAGSGSSWELGTPNGKIIQGASSGSNSWMTGLSSNYNNNEDSYIMGPCFDFTALDDPQIVLDVWWDSEFSWDGTVLQASVDNGITWTTIGDMGDPFFWYNDNSINGAPGGSQVGWTGTGSNSSAGWVTAKHRLDGLAGEPAVLLRFAFGSDGAVNGYDGIAIDDIAIGNAPAIALADTVSACGHITIDATVGPNHTYKWSSGQAQPELFLLADSVTTTTTYDLTVLNQQYGFWNDKSIVVILEPGPYVELGEDTLVCGGTSLDLDAGNPGMNHIWENGSAAQIRNVTSDGTFYVEVSHANGCTKYDTISVDFEPIPKAVITATDDPQTNFHTFSSAGSAGSSFTWDFGDGNGSRLPDPAHYFMIPGQYAVTLTVTNACGTDDTTVIITNTNVGVEEVTGQGGFKVYPNPSSGVVTISMASDNGDEVGILVLDLNGRVMRDFGKQPIDKGVVRKIDLSDLPAGIYFIQIHNKEGSVYQKLELQ